VGESSWALRIALLLIGIVVVGAIYIFGVVRRRQRNRNYPGRVQVWPRNVQPEFAEGDDQDRDPTDDEVIAVRVRKIEPLADLPVLRNEAVTENPPRQEAPLAAEEPRTEPRSRGRGKRRKTPQLDFSFGDAEMSGVAPKSPPPDPAILMLYLRPTFGPAFVGPSIVRNVNAVGMRHGELQIFHHFGAGDLRTEQALFSLANMFEPGHFEMQRIEAFQTAGLVMFLNLPAALDGPVAFELFLNTAQRLAEGLQADLLADPKTPLDSASIESLRRTAARFANHAA
jgi:cell division protein ZipA